MKSVFPHYTNDTTITMIMWENVSTVTFKRKVVFKP